jgi:hypothetical protein
LHLIFRTIQQRAVGLELEIQSIQADHHLDQGIGDEIQYGSAVRALADSPATIAEHLVKDIEQSIQQQTDDKRGDSTPSVHIQYQ